MEAEINEHDKLVIVWCITGAIREVAAERRRVGG
jgi:hypothetical protein